MREARLLALIGPAVTMRVPALSLHDGPPLFSRHGKLPGEHLLAADYAKLTEAQRGGLASAMARFYAELHAMDQDRFAAAGAGEVSPWLAPEDALRRAWPVLPETLRAFAERTAAAWAALPPDPLGTRFGYFDGHGWNMAFDHARGVLNGLYDFADAGFGPLHREFIYSDWVDPDLTTRIVTAYGRLTGRRLDRARIHLLSVALRLSELGQYADDPSHAPAMVRTLVDWSGRKVPGDSILAPPGLALDACQS